MSDSYQPSNGTEGIAFINRWCDRCKRDTPEDQCPIIGDTMAFNPGDPRYPKEWVYEAPNGIPECTAFDPSDDPTNRAELSSLLDLAAILTGPDLGSHELRERVNRRVGALLNEMHAEAQGRRDTPDPGLRRAADDRRLGPPKVVAESGEAVARPEDQAKTEAALWRLQRADADRRLIGS